MDINHTDIVKKAPVYFHFAEYTDNTSRVLIYQELQIVIVTEGILDININGKPYYVPKGYGVFISSFEPHAFTTTKHNKCCVLTFHSETIPYFSAHLKSNSVDSHIFPISPASFKLMDSIIYKSTKSLGPIEIFAVLSPLIYDINNGCKFVPRKHLFDDTIYRILEYIEIHFSENITLDMVAKAVGIHPVTVSKLMPKQTGIRFNDYIKYVRCKYASELIKANTYSMAELSLLSGFGSIRSFNRAFQYIFGMTPSQYKKKENQTICLPSYSSAVTNII